MTAKPSPRPWHTAESVCGWQNCIEDANGNDIGSCWYNRDRLRAEADARLIVAAVNERDRLRDIVRRLVRVAQDTLEFAEAMSGIVPDNPERAKARSEITSLLREARAAIGEDKE